MIKMIMDNVCTVRAMRMAFGIVMMVFLLAGGAGASTPITGCSPIASPGTYVLTKDIIDSSATYCININSSNVILDGNGFRIDGVGGRFTYGVYVHNSTVLTNVTIRNLNITDWYYGIYYEGTRNGTIRGNNALNNEYGIGLSYSSNNNTLSGNSASSNSNSGIYLYDSSNNTLSDNYANSNNNWGILMSVSSNNMLNGNNASDNSENGIFLYASSNYNTLSGNNVNSNYRDGIFLQQSSNNTLRGNNASSNYNGIYLYDSSNNTLSGNIANSNIIASIFLSSSSNNTLSGNNASNNEYGIFLYASSNNNILSSNNANSNRDNGIYLFYSSNNTLSRNTAKLNNYYGIFLYSSSNNLIYDNIFNNTNNFGSVSGSNIWNNTWTPGTNIIGGPYIGGNFWATPDGSGFSQTCPDIDRDGICDSSYVLDTYNTDYLPLSKNYTIQPAIGIYTDRTSYKAGDKMYVGLNLTNPGSAVNAGIYIWIDLPGGGKKLVASYPSITLPAGLDWKKYPWMAITLPNIPPGNYAWHAILKNTSGGIISESISPWTFGSAAAGGAEGQRGLEEALQGVPVEIDFGNEPE